MTQKEVLKNIIISLSNELKALDFKSSIKNQELFKETKDFIFFYQILIYNKMDIKKRITGFLIEPYVWINVKEIEKYYKEVTLNKKLINESDFVTIGNSIANIIANPDGLYKNRNQSLNLFVFNERGIPDVVELLLKQFKGVALPYFLNNASVQKVDELLNSNPEEYKVHALNDNYRVLKGIIAAKLNNNLNLQELITLYERQIRERNMYNAKDEMERLKGILPAIRKRI